MPLSSVKSVGYFFRIQPFYTLLRQPLRDKARNAKAETPLEASFWHGLVEGKLNVTLPSEAEWEKAARHSPLPEGEGRRRTDGSSFAHRVEVVREFPWGNDITPNHANYGDTNINSTSTVGCFPRGASPYELWDMSGNVWEWTRSEYKEYPFDPKAKFEKIEDRNIFRVLRGGAFFFNEWYVRCAYRRWYSPYLRNLNFGFRVVASPISLPGPGS